MALAPEDTEFYIRAEPVAPAAATDAAPAAATVAAAAPIVPPHKVQKSSAASAASAFRFVVGDSVACHMLSSDRLSTAWYAGTVLRVDCWEGDKYYVYVVQRDDGLLACVRPPEPPPRAHWVAPLARSQLTPLASPPSPSPFPCQLRARGHGGLLHGQDAQGRCAGAQPS